MTNVISRGSLSILGLLFNIIVVATVSAEPAPIPRLVVPIAEASERAISMFRDLDSASRTIRIDGAHWLQLQFSRFRLGEGGQLMIRSVNDAQSFNQNELEAWRGLTAIFGGSEITITLIPDDSGEVFAEVEAVIVGLPGPSSEIGFRAGGRALSSVLGDDLQRFIPDESIRDMPAVPLALCSIGDNRSASDHPAAGRIMPIGCTAWIVSSGRLLTAGHCIDSRTETVEFNVPSSAPDGVTSSPPVRDQYRVISDSIVHQNSSASNDWAVFEVLPNTETGLVPIEAQGRSFSVSNTADPSTVRIIGFGIDGPAPKFGEPPPRNSDNQTQQHHSGSLLENSGGSNTGTLRYSVDTQMGNSGSPVVVDGTDEAIGIHTAGGCRTDGSNVGTSFRNEALWNAL